MQGKLVMTICLAALLTGCEQKDRTASAGSDSAAAPVGDTTTSGPGSGTAEVLGVIIRIRNASGKEESLQVDLAMRDSVRGMDAVFFSESAVTKFVRPYYERTYGLDSVAALDRGLKEQLAKNGIIIFLHKLKCFVLRPIDLASGRFQQQLK